MNVLTELKQGHIVAVLNKVIGLIKGEVAELETEFPILGTFVSQFATDFGKKVLADAEALAPAVSAGTLSITSAAAQLVAQAITEAVDIAEHDATQIALNALRMYVSAPSQPTQ